MSLFGWLNDFFSPPKIPRREAPKPSAELPENVRWLWSHINERAVAHHDVRVHGWLIPLSVLLNGAGRLHREQTAMIFGLVLSAEEQQEVQRSLGSHLAKVLADWEDALEEAHGDTGLTDFANLAAQHGYPMHRGTPTQPRKHALGPRAPRERPPAETPEEIEDAIVSWLEDGALIEHEGAWEIIPREGVDQEEPDGDELLTCLLASSQADAIRSLTLGPFWSDDGDVMFDYHAAVAAISDAKLKTLRALTIGAFTQEQCELSWTEIGPIDALLATYPALKTLSAHAGLVTLEPVTHASLEELTIKVISSCPLNAILKSELPALRRLTLYLNEDFAESAVPALVERFPKLEALGVENCDRSDACAQELSRSSAGGQLVELSFALGTLTDVGGRALVERAETFSSLNRLDITECYVSQEMCETLARAFPNATVVTDQQRNVDEWGGLYAAVEE